MPATPAPEWRWPGLATVAKLLAFASALLIIDAFVRDRGDWDYRLINLVREIQFPGDQSILEGISRITGTEGAVIAWCLVLAFFLLARRWLDSVALAIIPL